MKDLNAVTLIGRLTRDMEMRVTAGGLAIGKFSIAQSYSKKVNGEWTEQSQFFDVVLMGKQAEAIQQYMLKGKQIGVQGELRQNRWQNEAGDNRSKIEVMAHTVQLLGGGQQGGQQHNGGQQQAPHQSTDAAAAAGFSDDVPFL